MIVIIHGSDILASRNYLQELLANYQALGKKVIGLEKNEQSEAYLSQIIGSRDLFGGQNVILLENILKAKTTKKLDPLWSVLGQPGSEVVIWEDGQRPASILGLWPTAKIQEFKVAPLVFRFLDQIRPGCPANNLALYYQATQVATAEMIFFLLARRFCEFIFPPTKSADWQKARLAQQARLFPKKILPQLISELLAIDLAQKTSTSPQKLAGDLELFLLRL